MPASRNLRAVRVRAGVPERAALAQVVPQPVELDADLLEPACVLRYLLVRASLARLGLVMAQLSLFGLERLDPRLGLLVAEMLSHRR